MYTAVAGTTHRLTLLGVVIRGYTWLYVLSKRPYLARCTRQVSHDTRPSVVRASYQPYPDEIRRNRAHKIYLSSRVFSGLLICARATRRYDASVSAPRNIFTRDLTRSSPFFHRRAVRSFYLLFLASILASWESYRRVRQVRRTRD